MSYDFRPISVEIPQEIQQIADLLQRCFPEAKKFSRSFLNWQYCENPVGYVQGFNAYFNNELVGHYACIPIEYTFDGTIEKGLLSLNTATHPDHRGKGLFTQLARRTYEKAKEKGYRFVVGVANANSTPGFIKKLDFQLVGPLDVWIGLGTLQHGSIRATMRAHKPKAFWDWRLRNPSQNYRIRKKYITTEKREKMLAPILAFRPEEVPNTGGVLGGFKMWIGRHPNIKKKGVFVSLPDRFKPSPLNLIWKDLITGEPIPPNDIEFELIDFDAY